MKKFCLEMLHGFVHLFLPIIDRISRPVGDYLHNTTANWAYPEGEDETLFVTGDRE